jgi:hypothetical protein
VYVINLWHNVSDYDEWRQLFERDPLDREGSGVRRYQILRPTDDEHLVIGHLEFDGRDEAERFAGRLRELWSGMDDSIMSDADLTIMEVAESGEFGSSAGRRAA